MDKRDATVAANNTLSFSYLLGRLTAARLAMAREERRAKPNAALIEGLRRECYWWEARCEREMEKEEE